ncbi:MAG: methyltransferase, partial [Pseudomonadota bacterium]
MNRFLTAAALVALAACAKDEAPVEASPAEEAETAAADAVEEAAALASAPQSNEDRLAAALAAQSPAAQARFEYRHPQETLEFFGVEPGMTVFEALPGGGWYTKILAPYLGPEGQVVGVDYALDMWPLFGDFASEEFIESKKTWTTDFVAEAQDWRGD